MSDRMGKPTGQGYNFGKEKARIIKARLKLIREEIERTGRTTFFDVKPKN